MDLAKSDVDLGLNFSANVDELDNYNVFIVTVPTAIDQFKAPDLTPLLEAYEMLGKVIKKGDILIYESSVISRLRGRGLCSSLRKIYWFKV